MGVSGRFRDGLVPESEAEVGFVDDVDAFVDKHRCTLRCERYEQERIEACDSMRRIISYELVCELELGIVGFMSDREQANKKLQLARGMRL